MGMVAIGGARTDLFRSLPPPRSGGKNLRTTDDPSAPTTTGVPMRLGPEMDTVR